MNRTEQTHLPVVALTHPGRRGKNNEDRFGVFSFRMPNRDNLPVLLAVLADGIGGHRAGEVAAEMVVDLVSKHVAVSDGSNPPRILEEAIENASEAIYRRAQSHTEQKGMGSTCAVAWIAGNRLYTATVGDSRIYLIRGDHIQQLSIDHTWIQEALDQGILKPEDTQGHPNTHVIRRYLGSPTPPQVDFRLRLTEEQGTIQALQNQGLVLQPDDLLIVCSDGLSDLVPAEEIMHTFQSDLATGLAVEQLIDLANERGGHDNITIIAIEMQPLPASVTASKPVFDPEATAQVPVAAASPPAPPASEAPPSGPPPAPPAAPPRQRSLLPGCLGIGLTLLLIGALVGGYLILRQGLSGPAVTPTPTPPLTLEAPGNLPTLATPTGGPTASPSAGGTPTPTITGTRPAGAPTLTPWPTHTPAPSFE